MSIPETLPPEIIPWLDPLREAFGGRPWIIAIEVLAGHVSLVNTLRTFGATKCLSIATSAGVGDGPDPEFAPDPIMIEVHADSIMGAIRGSMDAMANLPPEAVARVDAFDPKGEARVLGAIFDDGRSVAGRAKYGARWPEWQALEDKTVIDAMWKTLEVPHAPFRVVEATEAALRAAAADLESPLGTVWAGDNREGFHGGGEYLRWVQPDADGAHVADATAFFAAHCDTVRVMPFMEGIPCSIHGLVFPEEVIAFRPCEMIVLRDPASSRLRYAQTATYWDPPLAERETMRALARLVGAHLRDTVGYRGAFTIDGVMTHEGFRPTELNPRFGAAMWRMRGHYVDLPLQLINKAVIEGVRFDASPRELETMLVESADANRSGATSMVVPQRIDAMRTLDLVFDDGARYGVRRTVADEPCDVSASIGPNPAGGYLRAVFKSERTPVGGSVAPLATKVLGYLSDVWKLALPPMEPARDVHVS